MPSSTIKRYVLVLLGGFYGAGKTTLASTMPGPRIFVDAEGGAYDLDDVVTYEDYQSGAVTVDAKSNVVVRIEDYKDYRKVMDHILSGDHPFETAVLDSISSIQAKVKRAIVGDMDIDNHSKATYDMWDALLVTMTQDIELLNNMKLPGRSKRMNTVLIAPFNVEETPHRPIMQGGIRKTLPMLPDLQGFLHIEFVPNTQTGETERRRVLDIQTTEANLAEVKCRLRAVGERFGDQIWDPHLTRDVMRTINPRPAGAKTTKETK